MSTAVFANRIFGNHGQSTVHIDSEVKYKMDDRVLNNVGCKSMMTSGDEMQNNV